MHEVMLCADEEMLRNPAMMGLEDESIDGQQWLVSLSDAQEARGYLRDNDGIDEVWVASSDDVDPINLAAAMKRDRREVRVCLVAWQGSGSLMSRANAAGIDEVLGYPAMAQRYAARKLRQRGQNPRRRTPERMAAQRALSTAPGATPSVRARHAAPGRQFCFAEEGLDAVSADVQAGPGELEPDAPDLALPSEAHAVEGQPVAAPAHCGECPPGGGEPDGHAVATEAAPRRGYALCVASASGGSGKSTVSALSALLSAGHGYRTLLLDADLQFGDAAAMFGECGEIPVDKAVADPRVLDDAVPQPGYPVIVCAPERMERSELYLPQVPGLIDRALESFDVVVVNTGSFWTESHVQMIEACTNTLFLVDQRPTSVKALRKALALCARCGVAATPFLYAVNRCTRKSLLSSIDISCALNGATVAELKDGGPAVGELTSAGLAMRLVEDRNDLCVSLNDFLGDVIPAALGKAEPGGSLGADEKPRQRGKAKRKSPRRKGKAACL